jgi:hypothetical protein
MADQRRDASKSKAKQDKKKAETVLLTGEELRAIAGGMTVLGPKPVAPVQPTPQPTKRLP